MINKAEGPFSKIFNKFFFCLPVPAQTIGVSLIGPNHLITSSFQLSTNVAGATIMPFFAKLLYGASFLNKVYNNVIACKVFLIP